MTGLSIVLMVLLALAVVAGAWLALRWQRAERGVASWRARQDRLMDVLSFDQMYGSEPVASATAYLPQRAGTGEVCAHCGHPKRTHVPGPDMRGMYCAVCIHPLILDAIR